MLDLQERAAVKAAFSKYYKAERDRSEKCLGKVAEALCLEASDADKLKAIADALIEHYSR